MAGAVKKRKRLRGNLIALSFGLLLALFAGEMVLRLVPNNTNNYRTDITFAKQPAIGYTLSPNQDANVNLSCTRISHVKTNSLGFRDTEWKNDGKVKIAVMGDSFMEGLHMNAEDNVSGILEKLLGVEVMNTGISGYGTVANLMVYRNVVRQFHPRVVVLFFYHQNDFLNDHCRLDVATGNPRMYPCPCGMVENGKVVYHLTHPPGVVPIPPPKGTVSHLWAYISQKISRPEPGPPSSIWPQYLPPWTGDYADARTITRQALTDLKQEVEDDGGKLIIVTVPPYLSMLGKDFRQDILDITRWDSVPASFDPAYPLKVLDTVAAETRLPLLRMEDVFDTYRKSHPLPTPILCYRCDGHHNPLGHFITANATARFILQDDSLGKSAEAVTALLRQTENDLKLSPVEVLGEKGYKEIYEAGSFTGDTRISELLSRNFHP